MIEIDALQKLIVDRLHDKYRAVYPFGCNADLINNRLHQIAEFLCETDFDQLATRD